MRIYRGFKTLHSTTIIRALWYAHVWQHWNVVSETLWSLDFSARYVSHCCSGPQSRSFITLCVFLSYLATGIHKRSKKSNSRFSILNARRVTWSNFWVRHPVCVQLCVCMWYVCVCCMCGVCVCVCGMCVCSVCMHVCVCVYIYIYFLLTWSKLRCHAAL